jgi:glutamine amidotransferase
MGWNAVLLPRRPPIFAGVDDGAHFYFVHSYYVVPRDASLVATVTDYPQPFCSSIWRDNLFATQFHPEKSQDAGLRVLKNFAELG